MKRWLAELALGLAIGLCLAGMVWTCVAHGETRTRAALGSLAVYKDDRGPDFADEKRAQLDAIARGIDRHTRGRDHAALTITVMYSESGLSLRITDGQCRRWECDRGRARGLGQNHRNGMSQEQWDKMHGLENIDAQVAETARRVGGMLRMCGNAEGALRALTGRGCSARLPGMEKRMRTFEQVRARL